MRYLKAHRRPDIQTTQYCIRDRHEHQRCPREKQCACSTDNGMLRQAGKMVLIRVAARSPVFKRMFASAMKESTTRRVEISEVDTIIFKEMLRYIYTGSCSEVLELNAVDMILLANKVTH